LGGESGIRYRAKCASSARVREVAQARSAEHTRGGLAPTPDFEPGRRARGRASRSERDDLDHDKARFARVGAFSDASGALSADAFEAALAHALTKAAEAARF